MRVYHDDEMCHWTLDYCGQVMGGFKTRETACQYAQKLMDREINAAKFMAFIKLALRRKK